MQVISPLKDVEGLHVKFHYNLYHKSVTLFHRRHYIGSYIYPTSIRFLYPLDLLSSIASVNTALKTKEVAPKVKSILPCTPLAAVKCLEYVGVYNKLLTYGDRAYGNIITVINR